MEVDFLSNLSTAISGTDTYPHFPTDEDLTDLPPMTPDKFDSSFHPWGDYIFGIVMILVGLASLLGNGLAVYVFRRKGTEINAPEVLLLNIACVDLFLGIASYPATIVSSFSHRWIFGEAGCTLYAATCYFLGLATILSLTGLAIFRFIKTCLPHKGQWLTVSRTRFAIFFIYVYSLIWAIMPFLGWGAYDVEPFGLSCTLAWTRSNQGDRSYILAVSVCCVFFPTLVIVASHICILLQIRRTGQMFSNKAAGKQSSKAEIQFIRVSFGVCFGFLVAWLPYASISLWSAYGDTSSLPIWITPIPVLLAKSSIAYNPVIYVLLTRRYRVDFTKALRELLHMSGDKNSHDIALTRTSCKGEGGPKVEGLTQGGVSSANTAEVCSLREDTSVHSVGEID